MKLCELYGKPGFSVHLEIRTDSKHRNVCFLALGGRCKVATLTAAYSQEQPFRADDILGWLKAPKSLSEGVNSGPDKLQKTVPPPRGTEKGAIRDPSPRQNVASGSAVG